MLETARTLSEGFHFLRVDLYEINGEVYFSEFTFFSDAGFAPFEPEESTGFTITGYVKKPKSPSASS